MVRPGVTVKLVFTVSMQPVFASSTIAVKLYVAAIPRGKLTVISDESGLALVIKEKFGESDQVITEDGSAPETVKVF